MWQVNAQALYEMRFLGDLILHEFYALGNTIARDHDFYVLGESMSGSS